HHDPMEAMFAEPTMHFRVKHFPLVLRRIPVEGFEPSPSPIAVHGDGKKNVEQAAELGDAIQVIERNGDRAQIKNDFQRQTRRDDANHVGEMVAEAVAVVKIDGQAPARLDHIVTTRIMSEKWLLKP